MRWCHPAQWSKISVVRCGVDAAFLDAPASPVPADSSELVCVARLSGQKGLPLLLSAAERLKADGADFHLTIIGDGELRGSLEQNIRRCGLDNQVTLAGIRSSDEIRQYLNRARAFVLPSFAEGLPVVLMEALAMSRPVIATAIAGIPELVDDQCGWLIPAGSENALVNAMRDALNASSTDLAGKGAVGRERVHGLHDAGRNSLALLAIIEASSRQLAAA
jgi:glycosyltransferase involved in cell wall biosynthesis